MPELIAEIERIMEKKAANRPVQPEEFKTLTEFVKQAERRLRDEREAARAERRAAMDAIRYLVPDRAFRMNIRELELDDDINRALSRIENVGDLMIRVLADTANLEKLLQQGGAGEDAMEAIRYALDDLVILRGDEPEPEAEAEPEPVAEEASEPVEAAIGPEPEEAVDVEAAAPADDEAAKDEEEVLPAFVEPELPMPVVETEEERERRRKKGRRPVFEASDEEPLFLAADEDGTSPPPRKKAKRKRRELIFDEERGEVVARRRRKGSRKREEWEEFLD